MPLLCGSFGRVLYTRVRHIILNLGRNRGGAPFFSLYIYVGVCLALFMGGSGGGVEGRVFFFCFLLFAFENEEKKTGFFFLHKTKFCKNNRCKNNTKKEKAQSGNLLPFYMVVGVD